MDNFENFYIEYKKTKLAIYNQFCYACQEKYVQSLKYHTCYYATGGTNDENIDLVLKMIIKNVGNWARLRKFFTNEYLNKMLNFFLRFFFLF